MRRKIYVEADEEIINQILEIARNGLGQNVNAIDLNPILTDDVEKSIKKLIQYIDTHEGFRPYSVGFKKLEEELGINL